MPIRLPGLSERKGDIPLLAEFFCAETCQKHEIAPLLLSPAALRLAEVSEWPGNVRQLAHAVEAATIRASVERSAAVELRHLFPASHKEREEREKPPSFQEATRRFQKRFFLAALEATHWNITEAAKRLELTRTHVHNLLNAFELRPQNPKKKA
jgi:Nif-specific regulatory protein